MPEEFTMGFWVQPMALSSTTTLVNAFGRSLITAQSATNDVFYQFITGVATNIQPVYSGTSTQKLVIGMWNHVMLS
jgi:hypothetical protein